MISSLGTRGNLRVTCDAEGGCRARHDGARHKDPTDLDHYSERNVRRQARRRGWTTRDVEGGRRDFCSEHGAS